MTPTNETISLSKVQRQTSWNEDIMCMLMHGFNAVEGFREGFAAKGEY